MLVFLNFIFKWYSSDCRAGRMKSEGGESVVFRSGPYGPYLTYFRGREDVKDSEIKIPTAPGARKNIMLDKLCIMHDFSTCKRSAMGE